MINWFQRFFGKHHKYVLMFLLVILLLAFIVGIGAVPRGGMDAHQSEQRMFLGVDLNDQAQMQTLANSTRYTYQNLLGQQFNNEQEAQMLIFERIALLHQADEWQLPEPSPKQLEDYVRSLPKFEDDEGKFDPAKYELFRSDVQAQPAAERDAVVAALAQNARIERVREILGGPGYVLPFNAQYQVGIGEVKCDLDTATLDFTKFEPKLEEPSDAVLQPIFDKNKSRFQRPAQATLAYVKFSAATAVDPTPDQLRDYAAKHPDQFPGVKPDNLGDKAAAVTDAWRADQKKQLVEDAKTAAMKYARELSSLKAPLGSPAFGALLKKYNLALGALPPIEQGKPVPADSPVPDDVLQQVAFQLTDQQYFAPVELPDGAAVLFLYKSTPARESTFAEARADVVAFYREQEKEKQFTAHGKEAGDAIAKAMADGKTFAQAAEAQGLTVKNYPQVSDLEIKKAFDLSFDQTDKSATDTAPLSSMGRDMLGALTKPSATGIPFLLTLKPGEVSPMVTLTDVGAIFHVVKRETPPVAAESKEVRRVEELLQGYETRDNSSIILSKTIQAAEATLKPTTAQ